MYGWMNGWMDGFALWSIAYTSLSRDSSQAPLNPDNDPTPWHLTDIHISLQTTVKFTLEKKNILILSCYPFLLFLSSWSERVFGKVGTSRTFCPFHCPHALELSLQACSNALLNYYYSTGKNTCFFLWQLNFNLDITVLRTGLKW